MRALALIALIFLASISHPADALAAKRVALVLGMSAYKHAPRLANPIRDAQAIAGVFRSAGFDQVEVRQDLGIADLRRVVRDFSTAVRDADVAVLYYAGHGIEVDGVNYLIPADAKLESDFDVEDEALSLERVLRSLDQARQLRLVILDACRDNPFANQMKRTVASRAIGRGLAKVEPPASGTLIAFAARAGAVASDGDGANSPFTTALMRHITQPGLDLRLAFGKVRDDVIRATNNRQEPFVYGSLGGDTMSLVPPAPVKVDPLAEARREYEFAAQIGTRQAWETFLGAYKSGFYADLARASLDKLAAAEQASAKADEARRQAEQQAKAKADELRRQLEAHETRQAEEARRKVSEEMRQKLEESRRQDAEQAKRELEDARKQLEDARKQAETAQREIDAAKRVAVEEARKQIDEARREAEARAKAEKGEQVAALTPGDSRNTAPAAPAMDPADIARLLQAHLKRVGCDPGNFDGKWDDSSIKSLQQFNQHAGTNFNVRLASLDALDAVRSKTARICPLVCAKGQKADGERCVQITCDAGFLLSPQGVCRKAPVATAPPKTVAQQPRPRESAPAPSARGGGKCFSFNGRQYCE